MKNSISALQGIENAEIKIYSDTDKKFNNLYFEDNGTGISKAKQKKIFKRFFTTKEEGMGLGLYFCRNI